MRHTLPVIATLVGLVTALAFPPELNSQADTPLPFAIGERITYRVSVAGFGTVGKGAMWIEGPVDVRGVSTYLLRFDFSAGKGPIRASDQTSSWLDPERMSAQRYWKREKHMLAHNVEHVEMFPADRRWAASTGEHGISPTDAPLDELSFIYFIRTLPLSANTVHRFNRHFDSARSPTSVSVIRRETVSTPVGDFNTVLVEMRVKDPRRYKGAGVIRMNLTDDTVRLPVRIESSIPVVGTAVMTLETFNDPLRRRLAKL